MPWILVDDLLAVRRDSDMAVRGATRKGQPIAARVDGAHGLPAVHLPSEQSDRTQSDRTQSDRTQSDCLKSAGPVSGANDRLERSLAPGLPTGLTLDVGNAGDHPSIRALFAQAGCDMPANEFSMRLDEPFYEPHDRLLARRGMKLAGHVRVQNRELYLLDSVVPVGWLVELAALPEFGGPRLAGQMIAAAEVKMRSEGAALALVRTDMPALFAQAGWTRWGALHANSRGNPRNAGSHQWTALAASALRRAGQSAGSANATQHAALAACRANRAGTHLPRQRDSLHRRASSDQRLLALARQPPCL